jgi:protease-4
MYQDQNVIVQRPESGGKKFWRIVLGSMVGLILSFLLLLFLSFMFFMSMIASFTPDLPVVVQNSVLHITLNNEIVEQAVPSPFEDIDLERFGVTTPMGLNEILKSIDYAATDPHISGIYLNLTSIMAGYATVKEIRDALLRFKESGKFIYSYSESYSQSSYFLSSVADVIAVNPMGNVDFKGISTSTYFYKGLLEKLDVDVQVVRHGQFKSAVEPYILDKMSEANRNQMILLTSTIWDVILENVSKSRNISTEKLDEMADNLTLESAAKAKEVGMVDKILYASEVEDDLKTRLNETGEVKFVTLNTYKKVIKDEMKIGADKVAVIYAVGQIIDGKGEMNVIGSSSLTQTIKKAYQDDKVKAIVLRVNSPGGSAMASEVIWNEIENAKKAGKIVVTSMGDYAASGGYYIACNSDAIVTQSNTLTGSIGVFGLIPSFQNTLTNKLGVTLDVVKTNPHADYFNGMRKMDEMELSKMQIQVEEVYSTFIKRVADGRGMTMEQVDEIGQGRVWAGKDALNLKLVDKLGSIEDAIALAAEKAGVTDYKVEYLPKQKDWLTALLEKDDESAIQQAIKEELGDFYFTYKALKDISNAEGVQARLPMEIIVE